MDPDSSATRRSDGSTTTPTDWLIIYLKGLAMGAADAVPGVSGGTIALITGIYERLIRALTAMDPAVLKQVPYLHRRETRSEVRSSLLEMDVPFLLLLGSGMLTAVILLARLVQFALTTARGPTFAFFFGLIGASAIILGRREWLHSRSHLVAMAVGGTLAFLIAGASGYGIVPHTIPVVFVAGMIAISGMVLPGISGAFILLLLGQYDPMTATLNGFVDGLIGLGTQGITTKFLEDGTVVLTFVSGAVIGLFTVAYVVRWALDRYRSVTLAFLVSLMIGALRLPIIEIGSSTGDWTLSTLGPVLAAILCGIGAVFVLDRYTDDLEY